MTIKRAHKLLDEFYEKGKAWEYVNFPVAWALYQTWLEAEHDRRKEKKGRRK